MSQIIDIHNILKYLPHRYPFLMIDRVLAYEEYKTLVAIKNVSVNEPHFIGHNTVLETGVILEAGVIVGENCTIGEKTHLFANAVISKNVVIGKNCTIQSQAVVGSDGFGFVPDMKQRKWSYISHLGAVSVGANVHIGAGTTIDRGLLDDTIIESGVILDNQVQIGHNVVIGEGTAIAGCTAVAGSSSIGKSCLIGGACAIAGHLTIADHVKITGGSSVTRSLKAGSVHSSTLPGDQQFAWNRNVSHFLKFDSIVKRLRVLEKEGN